MGASVLTSQYAVQTKYVCEHHKNAAYDTELYLFIYYLQKACNVNYLCIVYAAGLTMSVTL